LIEISDNAGNTISQVNTDRNTGRYSTSFATGENLSITVTANGYWMNNERLILDPYLTIQDADRDILLEAITVGARFQLNNLFFAPQSFEIPTEALPELERLTNQLKHNPNVRIRIEVHSDALETLNYPNISSSRAEAIMRYMIQNGYSNIDFSGLRDSRPLAPSDNESNRRRNRRVEIIVIDR
jgi:outer membrane protein OmpA-like peptidoglycan-associated protein